MTGCIRLEGIYVHVQDRLLERPIDSMGRARLLDKKSSIWARSVCSMNCRVNGTDVEYRCRPIYSTACRANGTGPFHSYSIHNANSRGVRSSAGRYPYTLTHPSQSSPGERFLVAAISRRQPFLKIVGPPGLAGVLNDIINQSIIKQIRAMIVELKAILIPLAPRYLKTES